MARTIFRPESLDKLSSPDELDRLQTLVPFRAWIVLGCLLAVVGVVLAWGIVGRVPDAVEAPGVLVNPGKVRPLQSPSSGQVVQLNFRAGEVVAANQVLAVVNQPELRQMLTQARARLAELTRSDAVHSKLEADRAVSEERVRAAQEGVLADSIKELEQFGTALTAEQEKATQAEREQLRKAREGARVLNASLAAQHDQLVQLRKKNLVTDDQILSTQSQLTESNLRLAEYDLKVVELSAKEIELKQSQAQLKTKLADLRSQLRQLDVRVIQTELDRAQAAVGRKSLAQEQADRVSQLERQLEEQGLIRSPFGGRVLEVTVTAGQVVQAGARIGAIEVDEPGGPPLRNLAYFPLATGKKLREGMEVRITPSTVQRERYGSIVGRVVRVSPFPITEEAAGAVIGNLEVVRAVSHPGGMIEVEIELEADPDNPSGFKWTSAGPPFKFSAGTTTVARVTVEQRAPITYLIPLLRGL